MKRTDVREFTDEERKLFNQLMATHPKGIGQKLSVRFDRVANTIGMFFGLLVYSLAGPIFAPHLLSQELYISNVYQLLALPLLGVATALSTATLARLIFRVFLELRREQRETHKMAVEVHRYVIAAPTKAEIAAEVVRQLREEERQ